MQKLTRPAIAAFIAAHATDSRTLNIGVGSSAYPDLFPNLTTLDIDPDRKPDIVGDAHALPFPDGSFDTIICSEVLEHVNDPVRVISEMRRVLVDGGTVVITTRFAYPLHDAPQDYWRFTPRGLAYLMRDWEILRQDEDGGPFRAIAIQLQRLILQGRFKADKLVKAGLYVTMKFFLCLDGLLISTYGDIKHATTERAVLSAGVFISARKSN